MPASTFLSSDTADTVLQRLQKYVLNCVWKLPSVSPRFLVSSLSSILTCTSGLEISALMAPFRQLIACSTMFRKGLCGGNFFGSVLGPGFSGFPMSWCCVINENHLIVWVEVESCISKEVVEPFSIHSPL